MLSKRVIPCLDVRNGRLTKGIKFVGRRAVTHTLLMRARSRTVRYIKAYHDLDKKTIHLRSDNREHLV